MKFYRYRFFSYDNGTVSIKLEVYRKLRETPKGYWITPYVEGFEDEWYENLKKWIPKQSRSRFAYSEKEKAWINFITRTRKRRQILIYQANECQKALEIAEKIKRKIIEE